MEKTISSASHDVIVIKQPNGSYKSTPFQVAFSSNLLKNLEKNKKCNQIQLQVNSQLVEIPLRLDIKNGRIMFLKKYQKRNLLSDSSDVSDDDRSQRSTSRDKIIGNIKTTPQKIQDYKNQEAPKSFWQFAWSFKSKKQQVKAKETSKKQLVAEQDSQSSDKYLQKIDEQFYQGEQSSKEPMFHLSLCRTSLKKKQKKEDILKQFYDKRLSYNQFIKDPIKFIQNSELVVKIDDSIYTWELGIAILTCRLAYGKELSPELIDDIIRNKFKKSKWVTYFTGQNVTKIDISQDYQKKQYNSLATTGNVSSVPAARIVVKYRKTPDSQTIQKMNLKEGLNRAKFIMNTATGNQQVNLKIFLWDYNQKIVISDIDGTITKSDILGQLLSKWIHVGVTKLFTEIDKRNYKIVYLTARAIGQYQQTTKFLQTIQQDGIKLPQGPLIMSPDGYMKSFTRQVIDRTPDHLKTKILATINQIFPNCRKPIFCGFGNRQTDSVAYLRVDMDPSKIFCISEKSQITKESMKDFSTTYVQMMEKIEEYFPVYVKEYDDALSNQDEMNNLRKSKNSADLDDSFYNTKRRMSESQHSQPGPNLQNHNEYLLKSGQKFSQSRRNDQTKEEQQDKKKQHYISKPARTKSVQHMDTSQLTQNLQEIQILLKESNFRNSTLISQTENAQISNISKQSGLNLTKSQNFSPKKNQQKKQNDRQQGQDDQKPEEKSESKSSSKKEKSE